MKQKRHSMLQWVFLMLLFPSALNADPPQVDPRPFFVGAALDGYPITSARLTRVKHEMGRSPEIAVFFLQWPSVKNQTSAAFPEASLTAIWDSGAIPCLTWEPMYYMEGQEVMIPYQDLLRGAYDPYLLEFARQAAAWNRPFMIRFAHEMNLARYHWGTGPSGYGPESPRIYREMFHHVASIFEKTDAQNVVWVFCPNSESVPNASYDPSAAWNRIEAYYPGDRYVHVLGMDGYNWGTTQTKAIHGWDSRWREFAAIFQPAWNTLRHLSPNKPIMVFETATVDQGGDKGIWVKNAFKTARAWDLTGLVWFQVKKEYDWRLQESGGISSSHLWGRTVCTPHVWIRRFAK